VTTVPTKVLLHVGLFKTGTTFVQNVLRANQDRLLEQGIDFPDGRDGVRQSFAVWDLRGRQRRDVKDGRIAGQWDALVAQVAARPADAVLLSSERLSLLSPRMARKAVASFGDVEVRVVVTARDLARAIVSSWYEDVKNDRTWTWAEYAAALRDPDRSAVRPARGFWAAQDLARVLGIWESATAADRVTVVTVPPPGAAPGLLLDRFCTAIGADPAALTEPPPWNNAMVGVAGIEVVRRLNERMGGRLNELQYERWVKQSIVKRLGERSEPVRFALPATDLPWVADRSEAAVASIVERGYPVVGDLDDLRPREVGDVRRPDEFTDAELLDAALDALALVTEDAADRWWRRRSKTLPTDDGAGGVAGRMRAVAYRGQRLAGRLADKSPAAAKVAAAVIEQRDRSAGRARRGDDE
jgi:hypothetical protein